MLTLLAWPLTLDGLDRLELPELVAFVGEEERPLGGLSGLCDWRLCGALSRQVKAGAWSGSAGEAVLTVPGGRIAARRLFLFGLGKGPPAELGATLLSAFAAVKRAGGTEVATSLPGAPGEGEAQALVTAALAAKLTRVALLAGDHRAAHAALEAAAKGRRDVSVAAEAPAKGPAALRAPAPVVR